MTPELLSPAGTPETAMAAFDGGADAVYCGLGRFNARERAGNFTPDSLGRVIAYAHKNGKKVYLAVNTLLREKELPPLMELLADADDLGPDALIVQDPGVLYLATRYFPRLRLHASTQMGIHNSAGLQTAADMGFRRVILERQVTMAELRQMMQKTPVEVEVFIYGSLCCSLSGRCLLSAFTDAESGNRGRCKQPCRRRWNGKFALSPADLNGIDLLPELRKLGVASLKIEGRLRPPEYVWKTAHAFRILLDGPEEPEPERLAEARNILASAAGRKASSGFFFPDAWKTLIDTSRPGCFGIPAAEVTAVRGKVLTLRTTGRLHLGDRLRVVPPNGGDGETFSLTRLAGNGRPQTVVRSGSVCTITANVPVKTGDRLFKIGENGFDFSRRLNALPPPSQPVSLHIQAGAKCWRIIAEPGHAEWETGTDFAPPEKHALNEDAVRTVFAAGAPEPWHVTEMKTEIKENFFVPAADLKRLRREFWAAVSDKLNEKDSNAGAALLQFYREYQAAVPTSQAWNDAPEYRIPGFCSEDGLPEERRRIQQVYDSGLRRFRACSWYAFELLKPFPDAEIISDFPVPAGNSAGLMQLRSMGAAAAAADPELNEEDLAELRRHAVIPVLSASPAPLLVTRLKLPEGEWQGTRGGKVRMQRDERERLSMLWESK